MAISSLRLSAGANGFGDLADGIRTMASGNQQKFPRFHIVAVNHPGTADQDGRLRDIRRVIFSKTVVARDVQKDLQSHPFSVAGFVSKKSPI
jgi:hypothetical protein